MDHPSRAAVVNFPIDFLDVGILQARSFKPMGLVILDKGIDIPPSELLDKVKTVALRQVVELQHVKADDVIIFIRKIQVKPANGKAEFDGYIGRCTMPTANDVKQYLQSTLVQNRPLQVELWNKNDPNSPSHFYSQRNLRPVNANNTERDGACKTLQVEATQLTSTLPGLPASKETKEKVHQFSVQILCDHDVRALRRDLVRRICRLTGANRVSSDVDVLFKRKYSAKGPDASTFTTQEMDKAKHSFEDYAFACIAHERKVKIQFRIRPKFLPPLLATKITSATDAKPIVPVKEQPAVPAVQETAPKVAVNDMRRADLFGVKPSFGLQPASTAPPPVSNPSSGPFSQFARSEPLRMSNGSAVPSFGSLTDGFFAAMKQVAETVPPTTTASHPTLPAAIARSANFWATRGGEERAHIRASLATLQGKKATESTKAPETSNVGRNQLALKQVESMLTKFMINLNQTLQANFGDDASTLSIFHDSGDVGKSQTTPASKSSVEKKEFTKVEEKENIKLEQHQSAPAAPPVRHNAICDICNHNIVGTRFMCRSCPDWDCCSQCRVKVDEVHPGHCLLAIKSLDVVTSGVKSKSWVYHPGVRCDSCSNRIVGPRFKCVSCLDYDLCAGCESLPIKVHDEGDDHVFLKIDKPLADSQRLPQFVWQAREVIDEMRQQSAGAQSSRDHLHEHLQKPHQNVVGNHGQNGEDKGEKEEQQRAAKPGEMQEASKSQQVTVAAEKKESPAVDVLSASMGKGKVDSLPSLVPDFYSDTKKRNERTEDEASIGTDSKKIATNLLAEDDIKSVQERLTSLYFDAQKLPGAQSMSTGSLFQDKAAEMSTAPSTIGEDKEEYDMEMIKDVNMLDGTKVLAGTTFDKWWRVRNTGKKTWPISTILRMTLCSNGIHTDKGVYPLRAAVKPQEVVDIGVTDLQAGGQPGDQYFYFRMELPGVNKSEGKRFGQQLWSQVQVVDGRSLSNSSNTFTSARGEKEDTVDQWEHQGSSLGSSLFQLPRAPQSVAASSEAETTNFASTVDEEEEDNISLAPTEESLDDYEIIEPSEDEGSL